MPIDHVHLIQHKLKNLIELYDKSRSATGAELLSLTNFNTFERTIRRYRLSLGYRPRKSIIKVKSNKLDEQKRYQFATMHSVMLTSRSRFSEDECYLGLRNTQQVVWCKRGEPTSKKEISSLRVHVNIIGFIWWNGYIFRRFNGWLNSGRYCETVNEVLCENLRELSGFLYISDGIRCHRSVQFQQCCDQYNIELCEWPGYISDLNAIELIWNIIKEKVKKQNAENTK